MRIDFLKAECQKTTSEIRFGLYDAEDTSPVQIKLTEEELWNATVINEHRKNVIVTAIDNCIDVRRANGKMDKRCDCMLTYDSTLLLVELKNKIGTWQKEGLDQIENIVRIMRRENADFYNNFSKRKAIVANKKHRIPGFQVSNFEQRQYYFSKYQLRIQFEAEIVIK